MLLASSATAAAHAVFLNYALSGVHRACLPAHVYPGVAGAVAAAGLTPEFIPVDRNLVVVPPRAGPTCELGLIHLPFGDVDGPLQRVGSVARATVLDVSHATPRIPSELWSRPESQHLMVIGSLGPGKFLSGMELGFVATASDADLQQIAAVGAVRRDRHFRTSEVIATKLRPHPVAVVMLLAQLSRLQQKLAAHDATWNFLAPRLDELPGVRVLSTSTPGSRIFWKCILELEQLSGNLSDLARLLAHLQCAGLPVSEPEYLDDTIRLVIDRFPSLPVAATRTEIPRKYVALPGFVDLSRSNCERLLRLMNAVLS